MEICIYVWGMENKIKTELFGMIFSFMLSFCVGVLLTHYMKPNSTINQILLGGLLCGSIAGVVRCFISLIAGVFK